MPYGSTDQKTIYGNFSYSETRPSVPVANGLINSLMANFFLSLVPWFIHEMNNAMIMYFAVIFWANPKADHDPSPNPSPEFWDSQSERFYGRGGI